MAENVSSIRIDTKLDNTKAKRGVKELEKMFNDLKKHLSNLSKTNVISDSVNSRQFERQMSSIDKSIDKTTNKIADLKVQLENAIKSESELENKIRSSVSNDSKAIFEAGQYSQKAEKQAILKGVDKSNALDLGIAEFDKKMEEIVNKTMTNNKELKKKNAEISKINAKLFEQEKIMSNLQLKKESLTNSQTVSNEAKRVDIAKQLESKHKGIFDIFSKTNKVTNSQNNGLGKIFKSISKIALGMLGIRAVYSLIRKLTNEAISDNKQLAGTIEQMWAGLGTLAEPVISFLINGLSKVMSYAFAIIKALTGINILAKANSKIAKNKSGSDNKNLAKFDELNVLSKDSGGTPVDTGLIKNVELSEKQLAIVNELKNAWNKVKEIGSNLKKSFMEAWNTNDNGIKIMTSLSNIAGIIWKKIMQILDATIKWSETLNLEPLLNAIANRLVSTETSVELISNAFVWLYENILLKILSYFLEELLPAIINLGTSITDIFNSFLEVIGPLAEEFYNVFVEPLAEWIGKILVDYIDELSKKFSDLSNWIDENKNTVETIIIVLSSFVVAWGLVNGAIAIFNTVIAIATGLTTAFGAVMAFITSPIGIAILIIGTIIAVIVLLIKHWDKVKEVAGNVWNSIVDFASKAWDKLKSITNSLGQGIKNVFKGISDFVGNVFNGLVNIVKSPLNMIISLINNTLGSIKFDIPSWIPVIGGNSFSFPKIPHLAKGAVIPPNKEFMAVLGDQTRGTNIETPESLLRQIYQEETSRSNAEIIRLLKIIASKNFGITRREVGEAAIGYVEDETLRTGNNPVLLF